MIRILLTMGIWCLIQTTLFSQIDTLWERTYGGPLYDGGRSVAETSDGGFIITGYTYSSGAGYADVILIKTDSSGNEEWTKTIGGIGFDYGLSVRQTDDDGYVIAGFTTSFGNGSEDVYLIKTDSGGNVEWQQTYGGMSADAGNAVVQTPDGGYIVTGFTQSAGMGEDDGWIIKVSQSGDLEWANTYGGTRMETTVDIDTTDDGNLIVFGSTGSPGITSGNSDFYLIKIDLAGTTKWIKTYGAAGTLPYDWGNDILQIIGGGFIGVGNSNVGSPMDMCAVRTSSDGNKIWMKNYGRLFYDYANSICETDNGEFFICGVTKSYDFGDNDIYIIKIDSLGNKIWEKSFGGPENDWASAICRTSDGHYALVGHTLSRGSGGSDACLIKLCTLLPQFHGEPSIGVLPLDVHFHDQSLGDANSWQWDLDNDGTVDSYEQNPTWIYQDTGIFTVRLTVSNGYETKTIVRENYIRVINGVSVHYDEGWNLLSLPVIPNSKVAFPMTFAYTGSYQPRDSIDNSCGYWAKPTEDYTYVGIPLTVDTIDVTHGWNIIGSISMPVQVTSIYSIPPQIVTSNFMGYNPDTGYTVATIIEPGRGYWVRTQETGKLVLSTVESLYPEQRIRIRNDGELPPLPPEANRYFAESPPTDYKLYQNYPNPFNPSTVITYDLPTGSDVTIKIYDLLGQTVEILTSGIQNAGRHSVTWIADKNASGTYFCCLEATASQGTKIYSKQIRRMFLVR